MALVAYTPGPIPEAPMPACWNSSDLASILIYKKSNDDVVIRKEFQKKRGNLETYMISAQFRSVAQIGMVRFCLDMLVQLLVGMIRTGRLLRGHREGPVHSGIRMMWMPRTRWRSKGEVRITGSVGARRSGSSLRWRMDLVLLMLLLLLRMQWEMLVRIHHRWRVQVIVRMVMVLRRRWSVDGGS